MSDIDLGQSLYDMNKQLSATEDVLTAPELAKKQLDLQEWFKDNIDVGGYAMLLNNELHYYTIFYLDDDRMDTYGQAASECIGCCSDRGEIVSMSLRPEDNNYEIWVRMTMDEDTTEDYIFMLFPCDDFVIECGVEVNE